MAALRAWARARPVALAALLGLALRLALWAQPLHQPANDEVEYIAVARDLLAGRGWVFYDSYHWLRAPLYPLWLAGSLWLAGGDLHLAALPNVVLSAACVPLAAALATALAGRRAAGAAALATALLWTNATFASLSMSETLFTALFSGALLLTLRAPAARRPLAVALAAGALFGLAALTRSAVLPFLPLAAAWAALATSSGRGAATDRPARPTPRGLALAAALLAAAALTIAPWTARNTIAYGRPVLIETGLSYNLWAFSEPRESLDEIERQLDRIPNVADRSDFATARGLARLREDPAIVLRKIWPNWVYLARVKPIQDRFLMESYYGSVGLPLFAAALIFDDLLYVLIALGAVVGLLAYRRDPQGGAAPMARLLALAWLAASVGTMLLTHGEARYRHFLFPALIPYAAWALRERPRLRQNPPSAAAAAALSAVFLWTVATSYPAEWAGENLARAWHTAAGDAWRAAGQAGRAEAEYERAAAAQPAPDPLLRLGDTARQAGDEERALAAYRKARRLVPIYEPTAIRLGDLLRSRGDAEGARAAFMAPYLDQQRMADWSWRDLRAPAPARLAVGGGLDYGFVQGVYPAEDVGGVRARWTGPEARLRLAAGGAGPATLRLRIGNQRPGAAPADVQVCAAGVCRTVRAEPGWRTYALPVDAPAGELTVALRVRPFVAEDGRELGVLLASASLER